MKSSQVWYSLNYEAVVSKLWRSLPRFPLRHVAAVVTTIPFCFQCSNSYKLLVMTGLISRSEIWIEIGDIFLSEICVFISGVWDSAWWAASLVCYATECLNRIEPQSCVPSGFLPSFLSAVTPVRKFSPSKTISLLSQKQRFMRSWCQQSQPEIQGFYVLKSTLPAFFIWKVSSFACGINKWHC